MNEIVGLVPTVADALKNKLGHLLSERR